MTGVYAKALEVYKRRGGATGMLCTGEGLVCLVGAIAVAATDATDDELRGWDMEKNEWVETERFYRLPEVEALKPLMAEMYPDLQVRQVWWLNDRLKREQIVEFLEEAARRYPT